ncbi:hypothetical protein [Aquimarina rubra]|uniref:Lipoprotein n=1 Tax=Aquimarina rubra TaxID=1920033 RepID=A0ABW5LAJ4_9FLAO
MKVFTKFILLLILGVTTLVSCSEEDIIEELSGGCVPLSAVENYSAALERYSNNPNVENCEALKNASISYLRALDDCPLIEDSELEEALRDTSEASCESAD